MERKKKVKWSFPEVPEDKPTAKLWDGEEYCTMTKKRNSVIQVYTCIHNSVGEMLNYSMHQTKNELSVIK